MNEELRIVWVLRTINAMHMILGFLILILLQLALLVALLLMLICTSDYSFTQ